jgi:hypothetical protein
VAFIAEASELLSSTLEERQAVALIAQLMVPRLAAWCAVFLAGPADGTRPAYVWHEDEARMDGLTRLLSEIPPPAAAAGEAAELAGVPGVAAAQSSGVSGAVGSHAAQSWAAWRPAVAGPAASRVARAGQRPDPASRARPGKRAAVRAAAGDQPGAAAQPAAA